MAPTPPSGQPRLPLPILGGGGVGGAEGPPNHVGAPGGCGAALGPRMRRRGGRRGFRPPVCLLRVLGWGGGMGGGPFVAHSAALVAVFARRRPLSPVGSEHKERNEGGVERPETNAERKLSNN